MKKGKEGVGNSLLVLPNYTPEEMIADLEHDRMVLAAFGHIPPVRTIPTRGSNCNVLEWTSTPRP